MALAALAAGADGLLIEVHPDPDHALSDGAQSLDFDRFERLLAQLESLAGPLRRVVPSPAGNLPSLTSPESGRCTDRH